MLDNEGSEDFPQLIKKEGINYEKVLLHMHHHNVAEKAMHTFKNHFISILASIDKNSQCISVTIYYHEQ